MNNLENKFIKREYKDSIFRLNKINKIRRKKLKEIFKKEFIYEI